MDYEVSIADSQQGAADAIAETPDLVVLDLHASGIDTQQVIAEAKERDVPVLAFGRHTETDVLRAAREAGCDAVVVRSTFVEELPQLLRELLQPKTSTDPR